MSPTLTQKALGQLEQRSTHLFEQKFGGHPHLDVRKGKEMRVRMLSKV